MLKRCLNAETTRADARIVHLVREEREALPTQTIRGVQMHFRPVAFLLGNVDGQSVEVLIFKL